MDMNKLLLELKNGFGLRDKHIQIIKVLDKWPLTADQISKQAEIPLGRVYEYLNQLIELKLIEKTSKKPYFYEIKDLNKNIIDFIKHRSDQMVESKSRVMNLMVGTGAPEHIEMIDTKEKYSLVHLDIVSESSEAKIICHHNSFPFALYPRRWDDFLATRNLVRKQRSTIAFADYNSIYLIFKTYKDIFDMKKTIHIIMERSTWDKTIEMFKEEFGTLYVRHYLREVEKRLLEGEVEVYLTEEYQPIEVDLNNIRVGVAIRHGELTTGIVVQSSKSLAVFHKLFDQAKSRSIPLLRVLDEMKNQKLTEITKSES